MKTTTIGKKQKFTWKMFIDMLKDAFVKPFRKDESWHPDSFTERLEFVNQVKELECDAIRKV